MNDIKKLVGGRIKEIRKQRGLSQEQLTEKIGIAPKYLSRIELGNNFPYIGTLESIAAALDVEVKDLFDFEHLKSPEINNKDLEKLLGKMDKGRLKLAYKLIKAVS